MPKAQIIGAGLSGLYAACYLSGNGYGVSVYEKNESVGGRSRTFESDGFKFDMGPSWYWMPDLIDRMFEDLGENRKDYFSLQRLDPSYRVFWKDSAPTDVPAGMNDLKKLFDSFEPNGGKKLEKFLADAKVKYDVAVKNFLFQPGLKWKELAKPDVVRYFFRLNLFKSVSKEVEKTFQSEKARALLNFPVLFLGEMPNRIPSLYTLMNYADFGLGTWYPEGGMSALAKALEKIAIKNGVEFHFNSSLESVSVKGKEVDHIQISGEELDAENLLVSADYHFVEQNLIPKEHRSYSEKYWDDRKLAPSCLIYYLGIDTKVPNLLHHNLFFDESLEDHGKQIYANPSWPNKPLFYVCAPSKTDAEVAPEGKENLFILIPVAPDLEPEKETKDHFLNIVLGRIEKQCGIDLTDKITYRRDYCIEDFKADYNAFKGNAYGLANTLKQTANLKPKITSKIENLMYCGQLTVPGPGVPPALISGQLAASLIIKRNEKLKYETAI